MVCMCSSSFSMKVYVHVIHFPLGIVSLLVYTYGVQSVNRSKSWFLADIMHTN